MSEQVKEISEIVRSEVNLHGELHLNAHNTALLIQWLQKTEAAIDLYEKSAEILSVTFKGEVP